MVMKKLLTLCVIHEHPRVLLGMKKRGFGVGGVERVWREG